MRPAAKSGLALVPCGSCENCSINRKRILQNRIILEACIHKDVSHVALTYNDECLPNPAYIEKKVHQKFMKKLRRRLNKKVKYYVVGEYGFEGERIWNPHYHIILYNVDPVKDFVSIAESWTNKEGMLQCDIEQLQPVQLTPELAAYCAGYVAKKAKTEENRWVDRDYAFMYKNFPKKNLPYATWSNGLGKETIEHIKKRVDQYDERFNTIRTGGRKYPLGRYLKQFSDDKKYKEKLIEFWIGQQDMYKNRMKELPKSRYNEERRTL